MSAALAILAWTALAQPGFAWDLPPGVVGSAEIPGELVAGGIPVRMRKLTVALPADAVGRHFLGSFTRQGLYVPEGQPYDRVITGVRPSDYRTFTVLIQRIDAKHCGVILGEALPLAAAKGRDLGGGLLFPGATQPFATRFESGSTVSFRARASEAELGSFYGEVLPKLGFARSASGGWRGANEELSILSMRDPKDPALVHVVLVRRLAPAEETLR